VHNFRLEEHIHDVLLHMAAVDAVPEPEPDIVAAVLDTHGPEMGYLSSQIPQTTRAKAGSLAPGIVAADIRQLLGVLEVLGHSVGRTVVVVEVGRTVVAVALELVVEAGRLAVLELVVEHMSSAVEFVVEDMNSAVEPEAEDMSSAVELVVEDMRSAAGL